MEENTNQTIEEKSKLTSLSNQGTLLHQRLQLVG